MWSIGWYSSPTTAPPCSRDEFADPVVHDVRPDVIGRRQVEALRAGRLHQPRDERIELLCRHRTGAEDERIRFLAFVLLRVDVKRPALHHRRLLDGLARGTVDAAEDDVDSVLLDQLGRRSRRCSVVGGSVLEVQLQLPPQQPALGVDVVDDHPRDVGVGQADERERTGLLRNDSHFDGITTHARCFRHHSLPCPTSLDW